MKRDMLRNSFLGLVTLCGVIAAPVAGIAAELQFEGILGNSGESGDSLVKSVSKGSPRDTFGMVVDRFGTIWASAGQERMNRYSLDGRLLAHFQVPRGTHMSRMTIVGDDLVFLGERDCYLFKLNINAEPGAKAASMGIKNVTKISFGSCNGKMLYVTKDDNDLFELDVAAGKSRKLGTIPQDKGRCEAVELLPDGSIYLSLSHSVYSFKNGKLSETSLGKSPGGYMQYLDGYWYGHVWHGTIRKYQKNFDTTPGVVYGGNSGSFIGHVRSNEELSHGRGLAKLSDKLFVSSGIGDIVFLLEWVEEKKQFNEVRRIGALTWHRNGIIINDEGDILVRNGRWHWTDRPDTPFYETTGMRIGGQLVMTPNNTICGPGLIYDTGLAWVNGSMEQVGAIGQRWVKGVKFRKDETGTVAFYDKKRQRCAITVTKKGNPILYGLNHKWIPASAKPIELKTKGTAKKWNNLALPASDKLLAGVDGQIIEFAPDGENWKEVKRWDNWGSQPDQKFGETLFLSTDNGLLWVSDTDRHRVLCFDLNGNKPLGQFGKTDKPGTGLDELDGPTGISSRGVKAALIDGNNERVVKLLLKK